jgi:hypothetical protein
MLFAGAAPLLGTGNSSNARQSTTPAQTASRTYLGFDRNDYPGDAVLPVLRKTFSFAGYWLNAPPGETSNTWRGKREILDSNGFGFLVLFNGRLEREIKPPTSAAALGASDAAIAIEAATVEGFPPGTVIFLDQEEGGRMTAIQRAYIYAWSDAVSHSSYRAGIYCSGIAARETATISIITANDLRDNGEDRKMIFFVYNDMCPPSPGCAFSTKAPAPFESGVPFAAVWQFAQSPRRRPLTQSCANKYAADGNCYAPLLRQADALALDVDSAISPDPSAGRR